MTAVSDGGSSLLERLHAVQVASGVGLLHLVSVLLAIVAIILAVAGVYAFFNFRGVARRQAREEARKIASEVAEKAAIGHLERELPKMVAEYHELVRNSAANEMADEIAKAQDDGEPENGAR